MNERKWLRATLLILSVPIVMIIGCDDRFRYPCQDPANWDKDECKRPICEVTRTCPEQIFKGTPDPVTGKLTTPGMPPVQACSAQVVQGVECAKQ